MGSDGCNDFQAAYPELSNSFYSDIGIVLKLFIYSGKNSILMNTYFRGKNFFDILLKMSQREEAWSY